MKKMKNTTFRCAKNKFKNASKNGENSIDKRKITVIFL